MSSAEPDQVKRPGLFGRLKAQLVKSRRSLVDNVRTAFTGRSSTEDIFEALEEILIRADFGVDTTHTILEDLRKRARGEALEGPDAVIEFLKAELIKLLDTGDRSLSFESPKGPHVTLIAGVNGSGKTTTIGKIASRLKAENKSVILGAADTFRAAAAEQLTAWSEKVGVPIIKDREGADPASVAFDATDAAIARNADCLIIDTAGRLHNKVNLMEELKKILRIIQRRIPEAPHEVLLVLDATTGQNGLQQARVFTEALNVTGIVLTKLDGTARGGIAVAIQRELGIPIKLIGVGEKQEDLRPFDATEFVEALLATDDPGSTE